MGRGIETHSGIVVIPGMHQLLREIQHDSHIFPEDTNRFVTFYAGASDNEWSDWTEIVDNLANKFSDKITALTHISALMIESASVKDKTYMIEIAYGDDKTPVTPYRFIAGETTKLPPIQQIRVRADHIPIGEKVYYRMKCETGLHMCDLHIRYHTH